MSSALTKDRVEYIQLLAGQTAVSLNNALLYESLEEKVKSRTKQLAEKNKDIMDSIEYAKNIQSSIIPDATQLNEHIDSFIYYVPKDIVSGDFYYYEKIDNYLFIAAADCTGHDVPGALMSIVGHTGLTREIMEDGLRSPAAILNYLNHYIIDTLHQRDNMNVKDGMDIALSVIDISTNELTFAGAFNPLYQIRNGALNIIDANKFSIGEFQEDEAINEFEEERRDYNY